jgi:hypothetical protein
LDGVPAQEDFLAAIPRACGLEYDRGYRVAAMIGWRRKAKTGTAVRRAPGDI